MTTTTAPAIRPGRETIEVTDRGDGQRVHRYRWTATDGSTGTAAALETITPIDPAILADRWDGLMDEGSEVYDRLNAALTDLADGVTRRDVGAPDEVVIAGEVVGVDTVMDIDGLMRVIRDWTLERAARVAR